MYVSLRSGSGYALDSVGMYISTVAPPSPGGALISATAQIATNAGNMVTDSNWYQITGSFVASGGEEFVTIGVFAPDANLTITPTGQPNIASYYLVDDVCVTLIPHDSITSTLVADTNVCNSSPITIGAPAGYDEYEWYNLSGILISTTDSATITPAGFDQVIWA